MTDEPNKEEQEEVSNAEFLAQMEEPKGLEDDAPVEEDVLADEPDAAQDDEPAASDDEGEPEPEEAKPASNDAYARMRIAEKKLKEMQEAAATRQEQPKAAGEDPEPSKSDDSTAWYEWNTRQLNKQIEDLKGQVEGTNSFMQRMQQQEIRTQAKQELAQIEADYKSHAPDYDDAASHMASLMLQAEYILDPDQTQAQIVRKVEDKLLKIASDAWNADKNPAEVLYNMAKDRYGFAAKAEEEAPEEKARPDLKVINKAKKAATGLGKGGKSGSVVTTEESASNMTNAEFMALPESDRKRLLGMG